MQNIVITMCEKFHNNWLRNDRTLGNWKSDNNKKNDVGSAWRPVSGSKNLVACFFLTHGVNSHQIYMLHTFTHYMSCMINVIYSHQLWQAVQQATGNCICQQHACKCSHMNDYSSTSSLRALCPLDPYKKTWRNFRHVEKQTKQKHQFDHWPLPT